ncbi:hypothetical protein L3V23_07355 [Vibrio sp. A1-b2]|uniref:hypothetical protein n=1 Tax=Vibrio TaxID=662 RepID=UPI0015E13D90|nr:MULTISPECIES: hypothetical protein [Vibrio]MCF7361893.1 hypothetical protein [Vibrio sp. A1-b2]
MHSSYENSNQTHLKDIAKKLSKTRPTEKQRNEKRVRDRIEEIKQDREFEALWGTG